MAHVKGMFKRGQAAAERGSRLFILACVVGLSFSIAHPAIAQMTFVDDGGSHKILGPKTAAGAVIWSHGRSIDEEDSLAPTPGYVEAFRRQRWDAFRLNRMRARDSLRAGSQTLARLAAELKAEGYRRVVLAGQSYGAFMSLIASDFSDAVDVVIAVAPAAFGPVEENPAKGALNASRLYPVLERIRHARVMLFYFTDDIYDPGGRGVRSAQILSAHRRPYAVIDRPALLRTHWAGSSERFTARFGSCIVAFATGNANASSACHAVEQSPAAVADSGTRQPAGGPGLLAKSQATMAPPSGSEKR